MRSTSFFSISRSFYKPLLKKALLFLGWGVEVNLVLERRGDRGTGRLSESPGRYLSSICNKEPSSLYVWKYRPVSDLDSLGTAGAEGPPRIRQNSIWSFLFSVLIVCLWDFQKCGWDMTFYGGRTLPKRTVDHGSLTIPTLNSITQSSFLCISSWQLNISCWWQKINKYHKIIPWLSISISLQRFLLTLLTCSPRNSFPVHKGIIPSQKKHSYIHSGMHKFYIIFKMHSQIGKKGNSPITDKKGSENRVLCKLHYCSPRRSGR